MLGWLLSALIIIGSFYLVIGMLILIGVLFVVLIIKSLVTREPVNVTRNNVSDSGLKRQKPTEDDE